MGIDSQLVLAFLPAVIFFGMIPLVGAFAVRRRWRGFRKKLIRATRMPRLDYAYAHSADAHSRGENETGNPVDALSDSEPVSFYGRLEGIQSETGIWLGSKGISVAIDLHAVPIFLLPQSTGADIAPPDATPRVVYWKEMTPLVEGSRIFVAGTLSRSGGTLAFRS
ncbi:MAG: hypothetical protein PF508_10090, partial [Spirochaeta sp.]|nr:hypothetical protein [Spirochaeta sp.]